MENKAQRLQELGYSSFFKIPEADEKGFFVARVTSEHKEAYTVKNEQGEFFARVTGRQIFEAKGREDYPAVGDWVLVDVVDKEHAVIKQVLPRKTILKRRFGDRNKQGEKSEIQIIATNIDVGFVVESVDRDYNLNRFERYFSILEDGGAEGVIVLNKIDLLSTQEQQSLLLELKARFPQRDILLTSAQNEDGLNDLREYIQEKRTYCFLGSSGVGKSSLINTLLDTEAIKTNEISERSGSGKHTTTQRQMYFLKNGGIVIDNPGTREVGMADVGEGVDSYFDDISSLEQQCKYADCTHTHEPGCVVHKAIKDGEVDRQKFSNYINLKKETEYFDMTNHQKRQRDKKFGKFLKKGKQALKDCGYDNFK